MNLYAVIPSCCRPACLRNLVWSLVKDGVYVVVVDTGYERGVVKHPHVVVAEDKGPTNIQRWWNTGLDLVYEYQAMKSMTDEFVVAVLNDDLIIPPRFVQRLAQSIENSDVAAACPIAGLRTPEYVVTDTRDSIRMAGYAFALRGSLHMRADERFGWWYGDNDIDWTARQQGGVAFVGGTWDGFQHLYPDSTTTGERAEQAGRDRETFIQKWGRAPW